MMLAGVVLLFLYTGLVLPEPNCSYQDVLNYLNLNRNNELYFMSRPVKNYEQPTQVFLEVILYAILDVVEKDQKFIPYVWTVMRWRNEYISWDPRQFCGLNNVSLPIEMLWKPDIIVEEMTEKDKAPPSRYLTINNEGDVEIHDDMVLVSTCRMHIYKFPFDIQKCNLTFKSLIYSAKDLKLKASDNSSEATEWSREVMRTQYEWLFLSITITKLNATDKPYEQIVYTITMKRRSTLYIVNFLLPVSFFLFLDLASFLISDSRGEKLSFQVTVLLAVTVLQLILNEILPASSNRVPLIAQYCLGIFSLMLLSLLETLIMMRLREMDHISQDKERERDKMLGEECIHNHHEDTHKWNQGALGYDVSSGEMPSELLSAAREGSGDKLMEDFYALEKLTEDLREMEKTLSLLLQKTMKEKPGYWTKVAKRLNTIFFILYATLISAFLIVMFLKWI